jgi:hypothetical protein
MYQQMLPPDIYLSTGRRSHDTKLLAGRGHRPIRTMRRRATTAGLAVFRGEGELVASRRPVVRNFHNGFCWATAMSAVAPTAAPAASPFAIHQPTPGQGHMKPAPKAPDRCANRSWHLTVAVAAVRYHDLNPSLKTNGQRSRGIAQPCRAVAHKGRQAATGRLRGRPAPWSMPRPKPFGAGGERCPAMGSRPCDRGG